MNIFNNKFIYFLIILIIIFGLFFFFREKFINLNQTYSDIDIIPNFKIIPNGSNIPLKDFNNKYNIINNNVTIVDDSERGKVFNFNGNANMIINNVITPSKCTRTFWLKTSTPSVGGGNVFSSTKWPIWFSGGNFLRSSINYNLNTDKLDITYRGTGWVFYAVVATPTSHKMYVNGNTTPVFEQILTVNNVDDTSEIQFGSYIGGNWYTGLLDDMRSYNDELTPVQINQLYYSTIKPVYTLEQSNLTQMDEILLKNKPWALYTADSISSDKTRIFDMYGNNDRSATITGTLNIEKISGFGSSVAIPTAIGTTNTQIMWPSGSLPSNFTICSVTRYAGDSKHRILQATKNNWLQGHHWTRRGPVYYNNWIVNDENYGNQNDWIATCSTKTADNKVIIYEDNVKRVDSVSLTAAIDNTGVLTINNSGTATDQISDFGFTYLIIWDKSLTDSELLIVSKYLNYYIKYGIHCNSIINCGLTHHYSFEVINNNRILNHVNNSYDAITNGAIINTTEYRVGYGSLYLDGSKFVTLPNLDITNKGFTIVSWFKLENTGEWSRLFDFGLGELNNNIVYAPGKVAHVFIDNKDSLFPVGSYGGFNDNQWHHFAWTMSFAAENSSTSICKVYIDGKLIYVNNATKYPKMITRTRNFIGKSNWSIDKLSKGYVDDFRIYNRVLSEVDIMVLKTNTITNFVTITKISLPLTNVELTNMNNLLSSKPAWGIYVGESVNSTLKTIFDLYGNNNRYARITGNIDITNSSGNGAAASIRQANGTTNTIIEWPKRSFPANYTICSITRYTNNTNFKERILSLKNGPNFLHGHWGNRRGVIHNDGWRTLTDSSIGNKIDWLVACSTNSVTEYITVIIDDIDVTKNRGGTSGNENSSIVINTGDYAAEKSDFGFSTLIIWDTQLTSDELISVSRYLRYYLSTGTHCSTIQGLINNLQNTNDYKTVILNERLTNSELTNIELTNMNNLLSSKPAWGLYVGESINATTKTIFDLYGNNNRYARINGDINITNASGNGATANIRQANGTINTSIEWPSGSIPNNFTICSITRYSDNNNNNRKRILTSVKENFLHGHWGGQRGVSHYNDWKTSPTNIGTVTNWLVMCGTNSQTEPITQIANELNRTINLGGIGNYILTINNGQYGENSDFNLSTVMIWDQCLTSDELITVSRYLRYYLSTGNHCSTIQGLINNLQNTSDYKTVISSSLAAASSSSPMVSSLAPFSSGPMVSSLAPFSSSPMVSSLAAASSSGPMTSLAAASSSGPMASSLAAASSSGSMSSLAPFSYQRTDLNNYNFRVQIDGTNIPLKDMTNNFTIKNIGPVTVVNDNLRGNVFNFNGSNYLSINAQTPINCTRTFWLKTSKPSEEGGSVFCSSSWAISFNKSIYLKSSPNDILSSDNVDRGTDWVFYAFVVTPTTHKMYVNGRITPVFDKIITNKEDTSSIQFGAFRGENFLIGLLDDMRSYNYELSAYQINQLYNDTIKPQYSSAPPSSSVPYNPLTAPLSNLDLVNFDSLISLKNPWAIYVGESISLNYNKVFDLYGFSNRYGSIIGETLGLSKTSGFGANGSIIHLLGNENTKIDFPINSIPENYTICSITRYTGTKNNRIFAGKNKNIVLGHWNGKRGISLNNGVGTDINGIQNPSDWLVMCSSNSTEKIRYIADNIDRTDLAVQENKGSDTLTINNMLGASALETSQFGFSYLIIWDTHLSANQLIQVSRYLRYYLEIGTHSPKIIELINNLRNTNDVKSILSPRGETSMYSSQPSLGLAKAARPPTSVLRNILANAQQDNTNNKPKPQKSKPKPKSKSRSRSR